MNKIDILDEARKVTWLDALDESRIIAFSADKAALEPKADERIYYLPKAGVYVVVRLQSYIYVGRRKRGE